MSSSLISIFYNREYTLLGCVVIGDFMFLLEESYSYNTVWHVIMFVFSWICTKCSTTMLGVDHGLSEGLRYCLIFRLCAVCWCAGVPEQGRGCMMYWVILYYNLLQCRQAKHQTQNAHNDRPP